MTATHTPGTVDPDEAPDSMPTERDDVAAVAKALRESRLSYGTHSDRWSDPEWQQAFWTEAAEIALTALAPLIDAREQRQVWAVVYDGDTPHMDGTHPAIRMAEQDDLERAEAALAVVQARSLRAPKRNLRIETRFVTEWAAADPRATARETEGRES